MMRAKTISFVIAESHRELWFPARFQATQRSGESVVVLTSYNADTILAVDARSGARLWRVERLEYEGAVLRPNAIISDGADCLYVADTGLSYCRCDGRLRVQTLESDALLRRAAPSCWCVALLGLCWAGFVLSQLLWEQFGQHKCSPTPAAASIQTQWGDATARRGSMTLVAASLGVCSQPQGEGDNA